jgi:hypothetical protein
MQGIPTPTPTPTPWAYLVTGHEEDLTPKVMREWFIQSITPLVGKDAAAILDKLIKGKYDESPDDFLNEAIEFRKRSFK